MNICIEKKGNYQYAKIPGESFREGGKVRKKGVVYLGRVIDLDNHIFYNQTRGVFSFDPETGKFSAADPKYLGCLPNDKRKKEKLILDFGDAFLVDKFITDIGYDEVIKSIGYGNLDTLKAMVLYYIVSERANAHANIWYQGSFASVLYSKADLQSPRISEFLEALGREEVRRAYFKAHINWVKEHVCEDHAIIIDSTGLPNDIKINLTQVSNHNGDINNEARLVTAVQRDSGYPLMFRAVPGNIVDVSTLPRTITLLSEYGMPTDLSLLDAGYFSAENMQVLYQSGIDFVGRLPERNKNLYNEILEVGQKDLQSKENLTEFKGRYVYIKRVECQIGDYTAYGFVGYDVSRSGDTNRKAIDNSTRKKSISEMHNIFRSSGLFVLISSLPFKTEDILEIYYLRQQVEQYFDLSKGVSKLVPLRVHNEQRVFGHLVLCQIAATINLAIQKRMKKYFENRESMFMSLRNQKCEIFPKRIVTHEGQSGATTYYKKLKIECPVSFTLNEEKKVWEISQKLPSYSENEM